MFNSPRLLALALFLGSNAVYGFAAPASYVGFTQSFSVSKTTEIPDSTLKAGDYKIEVIDQLSDRMMVRVENENGKAHSIFLAVAHPAFEDAAGPGPSVWKVGGQGLPALRGFAFANGSTLEFVYPKAEAAAIATSNSAKVIAIDPESEGKPKLAKMSKDDIKEITLWMLTLTTASPNSKTPALLAQRYTPTPGVSGLEMAQNAPPSSPIAVRQARQKLSSTNQPEGSTARPVLTRHAVKQLPHTASDLPLIWLVGLLALCAAAMVRIGRTAFGSV
jgi:hypothetical protein